MRTSEQIAADDRLTEALQDVAKAYGMWDEGDVIMTHGTVIYVQSFEMVENRQDGYLKIFKDNNVSTHEAIGLFHRGMLRVKHDALLEDD